MIKNDSPEGSRLPEHTKNITAKYKLISGFINPSINIDISFIVSQSMHEANFYLELEEWQRRVVQYMALRSYVKLCKKRPSTCKVKFCLYCCAGREDETLFKMALGGA